MHQTIVHAKIAKERKDRKEDFFLSSLRPWRIFAAFA
jgi:hypothetical protein